jgi:hypothetical protein
MSGDDIDTLVDVLPEYERYVTSNAGTFITRFLLCVEIRLYTSTMWFVVMNNVFEVAMSTGKDIHERYDLKVCGCGSGGWGAGCGRQGTLPAREGGACASVASSVQDSAGPPCARAPLGRRGCRCSLKRSGVARVPPPLPLLTLALFGGCVYVQGSWVSRSSNSEKLDKPRKCRCAPVPALAPVQPCLCLRLRRPSRVPLRLLHAEEGRGAVAATQCPPGARPLQRWRACAQGCADEVRARLCVCVRVCVCLQEVSSKVYPQQHPLHGERHVPQARV